MADGAGPWQSGQQQLAPLTGAELVSIDAGGAVKVTTTTAAIAALASAGGVSAGIVNTPITTAVGGTLTAAGLVGGLIVRTGPTAAFSDATDTAAAILAALPSIVVGATFFIRIKNATAYPETLTAGVGVTLPSTNVVPPFSTGNYYGTVTSATAVTITHLSTTAIAQATSLTDPIVTALATNGAGTVLAAALVGGFVNRTTVAAPFTDTTDTAAAIIAAAANMLGRIGAAFVAIYANNSTAVATLTGGTGVTVSGITTIPPGVAAEYLLTYTAAATITMVGIATSEISPNTLVIGGATSGQVSLTAPAVAGAAALAFPPNAAGTLQSTSGTNLANTDVYRSTTIATANANIVPATVAGLVTNTLAVGTYRFRLVLYTTVAAGGGLQINALLTTTVMGVGNFVTTALLAASLTVAGATSVTSPISLYTGATTVPIAVQVEGTFTVTTPGTITIQMCQGTSNASNSSVNVGSMMEITRIA